MKRLVIYFHYDPQGVVDLPCRYAVEAMLPFGHTIFVTNGTLEPESRAWVEQSGAVLQERENRGFDVGAYRDALLAVGRGQLAQYDELILMNYTLAGPVFSLEPMFRGMDARRNLAFWGLTRHYAMRSKRFGGQVPEHLQSHFLAVRATLFCKDVFWKYWQDMPLPHSYEESIIHHETRFTPYFAKQGFAWDSYLNTEDLKPVFVNPIMACPRELIQHRGCPFFKRRSFFTPYEDELRRTDGNAAAELQTYLSSSTRYPVDALLRALLRTQPLSALYKNLHWRYVIPDNPQQELPDLSREGLRLVYLQPLAADAVTQWYWHQSRQWAQEHLAQAVELFRQHPMLGVLCPELPAWPEGLQAVQSAWQMRKDSLETEFQVQLEWNPPPAPCAGWALVREAALPAHMWENEKKPDVWEIPLAAQHQGYYSATFYADNQAAAGMEQLFAYMRGAQRPATVAKQLARLAKHRLKH